MEINARARVVPERAEDAGVSFKECLEVNIVMESRGCFRTPESEGSLGIVRGPGECVLLVGENS